MRQEGKTNLLAYLLAHTQNPYVCLDTMGILTKANFQPLLPKKQQIVKPHFNSCQTVFTKLCKYVWKKSNMIFAIEEINQYCTKHYIPPELRGLINLGGNRNIALWFTTRRIAEVHNDIVANCIHHFIFRTFLPQDVDWYSTFIPKDVILLSKDLPKYNFIYYKIGGTPQIYKPVNKMV